MALTTDWEGQYDLPHDTLKGGMAISGLFDLAPFPYTYVQPALQLTWDQVQRNSPAHHLPGRAPPLAVVVGAAESLEFRRQSAEFAAAWAAAGLPGRHREIEAAQPLHGPGGPRAPRHRAGTHPPRHRPRHLTARLARPAPPP